MMRGITEDIIMKEDMVIITKNITITMEIILKEAMVIITENITKIMMIITNRYVASRD